MQRFSKFVADGNRDIAIKKTTVKQASPTVVQDLERSCGRLVDITEGGSRRGGRGNVALLPRSFR